jgi:hypothetical protein
LSFLIYELGLSFISVAHLRSFADEYFEILRSSILPEFYGRKGV